MNQRAPRRHSWNRSQSDSFGPIKQVGVAISIGFPLLVVGIIFVFTLLFALVGVGTTLWILAGAVLVGGLLTSLSHRVL